MPQKLSPWWSIATLPYLAPFRRNTYITNCSASNIELWVVFWPWVGRSRRCPVRGRCPGDAGGSAGCLWLCEAVSRWRAVRSQGAASADTVDRSHWSCPWSLAVTRTSSSWCRAGARSVSSCLPTASWVTAPPSPWSRRSTRNAPTCTITRVFIRWRFGLDGNLVYRTDEVNQRRARLVLGWVTVGKQAEHLSM